LLISEAKCVFGGKTTQANHIHDTTYCTSDFIARRETQRFFIFLHKENSSEFVLCLEKKFVLQLYDSGDERLPSQCLESLESFRELISPS